MAGSKSRSERSKKIKFDTETVPITKSFVGQEIIWQLHYLNDPVRAKSGRRQMTRQRQRRNDLQGGTFSNL